MAFLRNHLKNTDVPVGGSSSGLDTCRWMYLLSREKQGREKDGLEVLDHRTHQSFR